MNRRFSALLISGLILLSSVWVSAHEVPYARPSADVEEMILAQPLPKIAFNPQATEGVIYQALEKYHPLSFIENIRVTRSRPGAVFPTTLSGKIP